MRFASPEWLILLPLIAIIGWRWPHLGFRRPLRSALLALLLLALVRPELRLHTSGLDLWVLADRSASAEETVARGLPEIRALLQRSKGAQDTVRWVEFADVAVLGEADTGQVFPGTRRATRLDSAIQYALSQARPDRAARLLVLTDGFSTEPLRRAAGKLRDQKVAMDYRLFGNPAATDYRVASLELPLRVRPGEPFLVEARITGSADGDVPYSIERDGKTILTGAAQVKNESAHLRFTDHLPGGAAHRYAISIAPTNDAHGGNNRGMRWIEVSGGPRVLFLTAYADDPLAAALAAQGIPLDIRTQWSDLDPGALSGARAVVINNVPAWKIPASFLAALDFYVREQSGGLWMIGGKYSFGAGGYFQSPIDPLLPVSMELKQEHRKLAVAMAVVLDRSGSMAAGVPGSNLTKMDMADEGAARGIELLGAMDAVSVIAVDSEPHVMVPLTRLGNSRDEIISSTRRIQSTGGGIYVYTGLKEAWNQLKSATQGQRHIILFADAADAEEPGDYVNLLHEVTSAGATVSVIGMGNETDVDAEFLKDVARLGNGRIFFNADASSLPAIFAQETIAVARSAFIDEPVAVTPSASWLELAARPLDWLSEVDGYNLSYLRDGATAAATSADEYAAPLIAFWQRGAGRVAVVSFPLGGDFSARVRAWPAFGDFARTLGRWVAAPDVPPGLRLRTTRAGNTLSVDLLYDARWEEKIALHAPQLSFAHGADGSVAQPAWERMSPGRYSCSVSLENEDWLRGAARVGNSVLPFGPVNVGVDAEWSFDRDRVNELKAVSAQSGGEERADLASIWKAPRRREFTDLQSWLLVLFLLLFLVEAAWTRLGGLRLSISRKASTPVTSIPPREKTPPPPVRPSSAPLVSSPPAPPERRSIFDEAKRRGR